MRIDVDKVVSVYSGKNGRCCCGCSGKHYHNPSRRAEAERERGYAIRDSEISRRMVNKVVGILNRSPKVEWVRPWCVSTVVGDRLYIAYLSRAEG